MAVVNRKQSLSHKAHRRSKHIIASLEMERSISRGSRSKRPVLSGWLFQWTGRCAQGCMHAEFWRLQATKPPLQPPNWKRSTCYCLNDIAIIYRPRRRYRNDSSAREQQPSIPRGLSPSISLLTSQPSPCLSSTSPTSVHIFKIPQKRGLGSPRYPSRNFMSHSC